MQTIDYLKILVEDIHSTVLATVDKDGRPVTRCIDMMLYDESGVYFLTAKGKNFYTEVMSQKYISLSAVQGKRCLSLAGKVRNIGSEKLDEIFEKNPYMQKIYPDQTKDALEVFKIFEAEGNFFDISDPSHVTRGFFTLGKKEKTNSGYFVNKNCIRCKKCFSVCPQKCIVFSADEKSKTKKANIEQNHCLCCGRCFEVCPVHAIIKTA